MDTNRKYPAEFIYKVLMFCLFSQLVLPVSGKVYDRHVIVVVDQTNDVQSHPSLKPVYESLCRLFQGDSTGRSGNKKSTWPSDRFFDEKNDRISLFAFGLPGTQDNQGNYIGDFGNIKKNVTLQIISPEDCFRQIADALIGIRSVFGESGKTLNDFLNTDFYNLFHGRDSLYTLKINKQKAITLSHYVFPLILHNLDTSVMASEYVIIIVTNYKSGISLSDSEDEARIKELLAGKENYIQAFWEQLHELANPFYTIDYFQLVPDAENGVYAKAFKLRLRSLENVSNVTIASNIYLKQDGYRNDCYQMESVKMIFTHDQSLAVNKILLRIYDKNGICLKEQVVADTAEEVHAIRSEKEKSYTVPGGKIVFTGINRYDENKKYLRFEYTYYTMAKDKDGYDLFPYVFKARRDYQFTPEVFMEKPASYKTGIIACILALVVLVCGLLVFIYRRRGKRSKVDVELHIWPVTNSRFMEVKEKKVVSYDCWYWGGETDNERQISVTGHLSVERMEFAKAFEYVLAYKVEDIDLNDCFGFAPEGVDATGAEKRENQFYPLGVDTEGNFQMNVRAYKKPGKSPDFSKEVDNILECRVTVQVKLKNGKKIEELPEKACPDNFCNEYKFIVKREIRHRDLWMAFDPGTSSSCVAYGIGGMVTDTDNIRLVPNKTNIHGVWKDLPVFPSKIKIPEESKFFDDNGPVPPVPLEAFEEGTDYYFGNQAEQEWGANSFQSIKKLLGYTTLQTVRHRTKGAKTISGQELAHLLIKSLCFHAEKYISTHPDVSECERRLFFRNSEFMPSRAIVAVPNSYTLSKVQAMVDTVVRLNKFEEVHFLYESEAVLMNCIKANWQNIAQYEGKIILVYDMGGATINITAFKLTVHTGTNEGSVYVRKIDIHTLAKIGYGVGGDDIDYALIQMIYHIPSIEKALRDKEIDFKKHQQTYKKKLLNFVQALKIDWIEHMNTDDKSGIATGNQTLDVNVFWNGLQQLFQEMEISLARFTEDDRSYFAAQQLNHSFLEEYVFSKVVDAVTEVLRFIALKAVPAVGNNQEVELVMSGRSVLYPGITERVLTSITGQSYDNPSGSKVKYVCSKPWSGFNKSGSARYDDILVKTAVASGACWYAMFSNYFSFVHNVVTSTFGFTDMVNGEVTFIPVINRNTRFDEKGCISRTSTVKDPTLKTVRFYQMLGADPEKILKENIRYKMNFLDEVLPAQIRGRINSITIEVDEKGNFDYKIDVCGLDAPITKENNPYTRLGGNNTVKTEITDENSEAYVFAATNSIDEKSISCGDEKDVSGVDGKDVSYTDKPNVNVF